LSHKPFLPDNTQPQEAERNTLARSSTPQPRTCLCAGMRSGGTHRTWHRTLAAGVRILRNREPPDCSIQSCFRHFLLIGTCNRGLLLCDRDLSLRDGKLGLRDLSLLLCDYGLIAVFNCFWELALRDPQLGLCDGDLGLPAILTWSPLCLAFATLSSASATPSSAFATATLASAILSWSRVCSASASSPTLNSSVVSAKSRSLAATTATGSICSSETG